MDTAPGGSAVVYVDLEDVLLNSVNCAFVLDRGQGSPEEKTVEPVSLEQALQTCLEELSSSDSDLTLDRLRGALSEAASTWATQQEGSAGSAAVTVAASVSELLEEEVLLGSELSLVLVDEDGLRRVSEEVAAAAEAAVQRVGRRGEEASAPGDGVTGLETPSASGGDHREEEEGEGTRLLQLSSLVDVAPSPPGCGVGDGLSAPSPPEEEGGSDGCEGRLSVAVVDATSLAPPHQGLRMRERRDGTTLTEEGWEHDCGERKESNRKASSPIGGLDMRKLLSQMEAKFARETKSAIMKKTRRKSRYKLTNESRPCV